MCENETPVNAIHRFVDDAGGIVRRSSLLQRLSKTLTAEGLDDALASTDSVAQTTLIRRSQRRNERVKVVYRPELLEPKDGDQLSEWM